MKNRNILACCLLALFVMVMMVAAQQHSSGSSGVALQQVASLISKGDYSGARTLIATIPGTDSNYGSAMCLDALCQYGQNDKRRFLKAMKSPVVQGAAIAPALRQQLEFDQIDSLFFYRKFEELLPKIAEFQSTFADSTYLPAVAEYQMAGLYERGMKKITEASLPGNGAAFTRRWMDGQSNLVQFLNLVVVLNQTNYQLLPGRVLKNEIVTAMTALGNTNALSLVPASGREETSFLLIKLNEKLQPGAVDDNLQSMAGFTNNFPNSKYLKRILFDRANISFETGESLSKEAAAAELAGDRINSAVKHDLAIRYFNYTRSLQGILTVDPKAGIDDSDVMDRQDDLLYSYYLEKDYGRVIALASSVIKQSKPGGLAWMMAKDDRAITLQAQTPPDLKSAASDLDDVLAVGFKNQAGNDHFEFLAVKWRIFIAHRQGADDLAKNLVRWVQTSKCKKNQKAAFMQDYALLLGS